MLLCILWPFQNWWTWTNTFVSLASVLATKNVRNTCNGSLQNVNQLCHWWSWIISLSAFSGQRWPEKWDLLSRIISDSQQKKFYNIDTWCRTLYIFSQFPEGLRGGVPLVRVYCCKQCELVAQIWQRRCQISVPWSMSSLRNALCSL